MVFLNDMAAVWRLCLSFGLVLISSNGAIPLAYNSTTMTLLSSPSPDLPPGTVSTATEATSTQPSSISLSYLHTHLPVTNISKSASKSFNTITPTNAILLTTRSIVNVPLSSPPNATQTGKPSTANVSTSNTILSNKFTNLSSASPSTPSKSWPSQMPTIQKPTNTESPISTPIPSTPPLIPAKELSLFLNGRASNVSSAPSNKNSSANLPVTRSDDFTGPVVMPVVANMEEFVPTQQQTTMSSLTQLGTSVAEKSDIQEERLSRLSTEKSLKEPSKSSSLVISGSTKGYLWNITSGPLNSSLSGLGSEDYILRNVTTNPAVARKINSSSSISYLDTQVTPLGKGFLNTSLPNVSTSPLMNVSSTNSSLPTITSVAPTTSVPDEDLSADYQADVYDVFTEDYVASTPQRNTTSGNGSTDLDLPSLRKKFLFQFTNMTNPPTSPLPNTTPLRHPTKSFTRKTTTYRPTLPSSDPSIDEDPLSFAASSVDNSTFDLTTSTIPYTTPLEEITAPILLSRNVTPAANLTFVADIPSVINVTSAANVTSTQNVTSNVSHAINKEQLQFPGITLKVSHVLIPKQKRSRYSYNIQNMRIELPKTESLNKAPPSVPKTSKNSNCTRFPVLVVTAADTESKEKVNLTEERYDCEFSSQIQSSTQQKEPVDRIRTYYGGYVFRYTIPKASNGSNATSQSSTEVVKTIDTTTVDDGDDYYPSYGEYLEMANGSSNSGIIDDAIFPDPIIRNEKISNPRTETYRVPLTESTIIDSDLHDRDVIDSVMYIYFGGASRGLHGAGSQFGFQIIIVGAVIALVAQFLTLASSIRRIKTHQGEEPTIILLNVEIALTLTNLIFILGVQSPGNHTLCRITAVSLYYLHLVTILWFLLSSLHCVQSVIRIEKPFKLYSFCICGWILPLIIASLSYLFNERSFETSSYCWVSPLRGVLFSYILPVIFLCSVCIVTTVYGLKRVTDVVEELDDTYSHRKLLRISAVSLPLFSIIWFTGMISLENSSSLLFSMIYLISNTVLNWLLFGCWLPTEASQWKDMDEDYYDDDEDFDDEPVLVKRRFDDQPLLSELYEYGAQGQLYNLRIEPISIISAP